MNLFFAADTSKRLLDLPQAETPLTRHISLTGIAMTEFRNQCVRHCWGFAKYADTSVGSGRIRRKPANYDFRLY